ncbi:MAG: DUF4321 domain-containing protein [Clostridia bacterium]|nr:DUF4321 domain-containing protein [Clostridia bacterium]
MRKVLILIFCVLGLIVGVIVGDQMTGVLSWMALGGTIGFTEPLVLDLKVIEITLGFWCKINIGGVIGLVGFALLSKWITSWLKI